MNGLGGPSPFSPHNDVLNAKPETPAAVNSLLTELKSRGRSSVVSKRYEDAVQLYTKAIEIAPQNENDGDESKRELSIFYSNRSLCQLQMNQHKDSYDDAITATAWDATYLKGFWRLGQAAMALKKTGEAKDAYLTAIEIEDSKALRKELAKVEKALEREAKEAEEQAAAKEQESKEEDEAKKEKSAKTVTEKLPYSGTGNQTENKPASSGSSKVKQESDGTFSQSDHVRGYKVVNGKKTSFFHHEQTEEEKRLIGDIAPKRIDPNSVTTSPTQEDTPKDRSAWNKAGTWEEKDYTAWAIDSLSKALMACTYKLPEGCAAPNAEVKVTKISNLIDHKTAGGTAHASVATVRGKKRYIFEFDIKLDWQLALPSGEVCKGSLRFDDVDGTHEVGDGFDVRDYVVTDAGPGGDIKYLLERFVRNDGLRHVVEEAIDEWIYLFRQTY